MKIAYLILAHNNPRHLRRLVGAVASPSSACFIHIDKKADIDGFLPVEGGHAVFSGERVAVDWGGFPLVEATLVLLRQALADARRFDRFVLPQRHRLSLAPGRLHRRFLRAPPVRRIYQSRANAGQGGAQAAGAAHQALAASAGRPRREDLAQLEIPSASGSCITGPIIRPWTVSCPTRETSGGRCRAPPASTYSTSSKPNRKQPDSSKTPLPRRDVFSNHPGQFGFPARTYPETSHMRTGAPRTTTRSGSAKRTWMSCSRRISSFQPGDWYGGGPMLFARKFSDAQPALADWVDRRSEERERLACGRRGEGA